MNVNIKITGIEDVNRKLKDLSDHAEGTMNLGMYEAAKVVADRTRQNFPLVARVLPINFGIAKFQKHYQRVTTSVGFGGGGGNSVANYILSAVCRSSGTTRQDIVSRGFSSSQSRAEAALIAKADSEIQKIIDKK